MSLYSNAPAAIQYILCSSFDRTVNKDRPPYMPACHVDTKAETRLQTEQCADCYQRQVCTSSPHLNLTVEKRFHSHCPWLKMENGWCAKCPKSPSPLRLNILRGSLFLAHTRKKRPNNASSRRTQPKKLEKNELCRRSDRYMRFENLCSFCSRFGLLYSLGHSILFRFVKLRSTTQVYVSGVQYHSR